MAEPIALDLDVPEAVDPRPILTHPDPRLRLEARPVERFDGTITALADELLEALVRTESIGLAAPQLGESRRVLAIQPTVDASAPRVYVNPRIVERSGLAFVEERCLSLPGIAASVRRSTDVRVEAVDASGAPFEATLGGLDAVCLQHEIDHLDGTLFVDRLLWLQRLALRRRLRALGA